MAGPRLERVITSYDSHEDADRASARYYAALSPQQRLDLALELMQPIYEAHPRFERVYRVVELGACPVSSDWGGGLQNKRAASRDEDLLDVRMLERLIEDDSRAP